MTKLFLALLMAINPFLFSVIPGFDRLNADEFYIEMNSSNDKIIIDVREEGEYARGHIEGALPAEDRKELEKLTKDLDREKYVFVYCTNNSRSVKACRILINNGFINVYMLKGGINKWEERGFPVVGSKQQGF